MAEIISRNKGHKKPMPRVDLTPMVDLGFLLITFFIVTTSMTKPMVLTLNNPADGTSEAADSKTLTLILVNNDKIVYYNGNDSLHYNTCIFTQCGYKICLFLCEPAYIYGLNSALRLQGHHLK